MKLKIINKKRFVLSITIIIILINSILNLTIAKNEIILEDYQVMAADTLWSIASHNKKENEDIRTYIYNLEKLNNINADLQVGQIIKIIK